MIISRWHAPDNILYLCSVSFRSNKFLLLLLFYSFLQGKSEHLYKFSLLLILFNRQRGGLSRVNTETTMCSFYFSSTIITTQLTFYFLGCWRFSGDNPFFHSLFNSPTQHHTTYLLFLSLFPKYKFFLLSFSFFLPFSLYILHWLDFFFCSFFFFVCLESFLFFQ